MKGKMSPLTTRNRGCLEGRLTKSVDTLGQLSPAEFSAIGRGANPPQVATQSTRALSAVQSSLAGFLSCRFEAAIFLAQKMPGQDRRKPLRHKDLGRSRPAPLDVTLYVVSTYNYY